MKKTIKKILIIIIIIISCIVLFFVWLFSEHHYHIKTEYGDSFTITDDIVLDCNEYLLSDDNSDFTEFIYLYEDEDLIPICDTAYLRCYHLKNDKEDIYIFKLKPDGDFKWINPQWDEAPNFFKESYGEKVKNIFLADKYIMELFLKYMDDVSHDEMIAMAEKFVARDFEGLDKYGLTDDMIHDEADLNEKIAIMRNYLQEND